MSKIKFFVQFLLRVIYLLLLWIVSIAIVVSTFLLGLDLALIFYKFIINLF